MNDKSSNNVTFSMPPLHDGKPEKVQDLKRLETKLKQEVDADFFQEPRSFRALPRVIDVLGAQLLDTNDSNINSGLLNTTVSTFNLPSTSHHQSHFDNLHKNNPAYSSLRKQQEIVEQAIEHLTVEHYSDLNSSVVAVGHVSRRFGEAVGHVKGLRRQVQEIRENLANASVGGGDVVGGNVGRGDEGDHAGNETGNDGNNAESKTGGYSQPHPLRGKSLRELWLKKLECEAVLSLLQKLDVIRQTPGAFDALIYSQPCRVGAAVVLLSDAIDTMFKKDVTQIRALHKITEQLMSRKQKAEEILWETLQDVLYLRTGNSDSLVSAADDGVNSGMDGAPSSMHHKDLTIDGTVKSGGARNASFSNQRTGRHLFVSTYNHRGRGRDEHFSDSENSDSDVETKSASTEDRSKKSGSATNESDNKKSGQRGNRSSNRKGVSSAILYPLEENTGGAFSHFHGHQGRLLPRAMVESELDVEVDELRCLEKWTNDHSHSTAYSSYSSDGTLILPRYTDPVLALRILVEALAKLGRLDDVERHLSENLERELRRIAQLEQAKTLSKLEKYRNKAGAALRRSVHVNSGMDASEERLRVFKSHLRGLLKGFGSVMLRLSYLTQILRHRIASDETIVTPSYSTPSSALHSILVSAHVTMQREIKGFLRSCLDEDKASSASFQNSRMVTPSMMDASAPREPQALPSSSGVSASEQGIFSLGIISDSSLASSVREKYAQNVSLASRSSAMKMTPEEYVLQVLCPRTGTVPQIRHALAFRRSIDIWTKECDELKKELSETTKEDTSTPEYNATTEETALSYLDGVVKKTLLPMLQDAAVNGTVSALERPDAFDPVSSVGLYNTSIKGQKLKVDMCAACQGLYSSTGPLFSALHRLPRGGEKAEMYSSMVAVLEHAILTFISRVKQRVTQLCDGKTAFQYLEDKTSGVKQTALSIDMEARRPFGLLLSSYFDSDSLGLSPGVETPTAKRSIQPLAPSTSDTRSSYPSGSGSQRALNAVLEGATDLQREQECFEREVAHFAELLNFTNPNYGRDIRWCPEDNFLKAISLAHSLLKLSSQLERRLKPKKETWGKSYSAPRSLRELIKDIRVHGIRVAKFCRMELLLQTVKRLSSLYSSSALNARDAVRLPSSVNELGEYLASISDLLREYGGNKIAAYSLSSLEQYVPLFLMQTARIVASGEGLPNGFKITLNGVEALDRSCSVLYRDLKTATSFENSFWDDEVAEDAFERAASYISLMELDMGELVSHFRDKRNDFTSDDYKLMFSMDGPRRKGDISMYDQSK